MAAVMAGYSSKACQMFKDDPSLSNADMLVYSSLDAFLCDTVSRRDKEMVHLVCCPLAYTFSTVWRHAGIGVCFFIMR